MAYTEEELAGLTDEERAALLDEEEQDEGDGADDAGAGDDDGQDGDDAGDDQGGDEAGGDADDGAQGDDAGGEDQPGDDGADAGKPAAAPILVAEAPEKAQERLQEITDEKKDLRKQYDDGEITFEDYESKVEALDDERLELKLAINTAETAARIREQQEINAREAEVNRFLSEVGIPRDPKNLRFATLDVAVRIVANDQENQELSVAEILEKAYELCVEQGTLPARGGDKPQDKVPAKPAAAPRKPAPPTLAKIPASAPTDTSDGSRFAYIDRITDPDKREAAFAKLSPADQEAYLQQA